MEGQKKRSGICRMEHAPHCSLQRRNGHQHLSWIYGHKPCSIQMTSITMYLQQARKHHQYNILVLQFYHLGCDPYVLDPNTQDGKRGDWNGKLSVNLRFSPQHTKSVQLILNPSSWYVQFHCTFDSSFSNEEIWATNIIMAGKSTLHHNDLGQTRETTKAQLCIRLIVIKTII